jgi:hypothetical protein
MAIAISVGARKRALDEALENTFPAADPLFSRAADDERARLSFLT